MTSDAAREPAPTLVTIITPSFNQGQFLEATLRSVAEQDYPAIEHIVMDGGSTDDSVEILRGWTGHPITWRSEPDGGQAAAINAGVQMATGFMVGWLNSDDVLLDPSAISKVMALHRQFAYPIITGGGALIDEAGDRIRAVPVRADRLSHTHILHSDEVLQPATFISLGLMRLYPLDESLHWALDWDLFIRASRHVAFVPIDAEIAGYRIHSAGKTVSGGAARAREIARVVRRYHAGWCPTTIGQSLVADFALAAERMPPGAARITRGLTRRGVHLTNRLTGGRGLQI